MISVRPLRFLVEAKELGNPDNLHPSVPGHIYSHRGPLALRDPERPLERFRAHGYPVNIHSNNNDSVSAFVSVPSDHPIAAIPHGKNGHVTLLANHPDVQLHSVHASLNGSRVHVGIHHFDDTEGTDIEAIKSEAIKAAKALRDYEENPEVLADHIAQHNTDPRSTREALRSLKTFGHIR